MPVGNISGLCQCRQTSTNEPNVFFPHISRRMRHREHCYKKDTITRNNCVVIVSPVGINADMNVASFKMRNA
jgi:hypothetical protein